MRLIDAHSLFKKLFTCSDGRICPDTDIDNWPIQLDVKTIKRAIREQPTVCDIEQIRAEIYETFMTIDGGVHDKSALKCMEIIDKYTEESEDERSVGV